MSMIKVQASLYCLSFILTESTNVVTAIYHFGVGVVPPWVWTLSYVLLPLQGKWAHASDPGQKFQCRRWT